MSSLVQQLLAASPEERARLLRGKPDAGFSDVNELAERARAAARANPAEGLQLAQTARALAEAIADPRGRAVASRALGVALWARAGWSEALAAFTEGERAALDAGDALLAAQVPILAVEVLAQLGRHPEALALADRLEAQLRSLGAELDAAKVVANAGNIHFQRGEYAAALQSWTQALEFFRAAGNEPAVAQLQINIANVLTHLNRLPDAVRRYEEARSAFEAAGVESVVAGVEGNLGFLQFVAGRYPEALRRLEQARTRFERLELPKDLAKCDRETADIYLELNLLPEAVEAYERVRPLFQELQVPVEAARCDLGLATALGRLDRRAEAEEALKRAEAAFRAAGNEVGTARAALLRVELELEEAPDRERSARAAERIFRRHGMVLAAARARLAPLEQRVEAGGSPVRSLRRLRAEVETEALFSLRWRVEAALARAAVNAGKPRSALTHYRRAVEEIERARHLLPGEELRIAFLRDKTRLLEELLGLLLDRGTPAALREAFRLAERAKSRVLAELLSGPVEALESDDPERQALTARLEELRAQLKWDHDRQETGGGEASRLPAADAELPERVRRLEQEYLQTRRRLQLSGGRQVAFGEPPELRALQSLLQDDEQLVEYVTVRDEVIAFVVDRRRFHAVRGLASRREVEELARRLGLQWARAASGGLPPLFRDRLLQSTEAVLRELYEALVEPLEPLLTGRRITLIPHGALHGVPFHALHDGVDYLLERWEIAYAPSAGVWRACRLRPEPETRESLLYGVSDPALPHVRSEVEGLAALLDSSRALHDGQATLAAVPRDGAFRYLHFATHAVFREDNPLFSGLKLADGWLIAHDLYRRRLECCLATLSACRTGVSHVAPGDETLGLVRGFLHAGARAVLVSLWVADDTATAELMQQCYARLAAGESRAAALREAQRVVRSRYPHPFHWAPFVMVGAS
ncbi:MAG: CHAT domain-containing protein [Armatimonadota bacterium]